MRANQQNNVFLCSPTICEIILGIFLNRLTLFNDNDHHQYRHGGDFQQYVEV